MYDFQGNSQWYYIECTIFNEDLNYSMYKIERNINIDNKFRLAN